MKTFTRLLAAAALAGIFASSMAQPAAPSDDAPIPDYAVYVDPPTGLVFVKLPLPQGWKFVGKVEGDSVAQLPPGVLTDLLDADSEALATDELHRR